MSVPRSPKAPAHSRSNRLAVPGGKSTVLGSRQGQHGFRPAALQVVQRQRAAVHLRYLPGDAQAQARAAGVSAARSFQSIERLEYALELRLRYAGPSIANSDDEPVRSVVDKHHCGAPI